VRALLGLGLVEGRPGNDLPRVPRPKPAEDDAERSRAALAVWEASRDPRETLAETYLRGRGLELDDRVAGEALRYHPALRLKGGTTPGMVCLFRTIHGDRPTAIHRTFLDREGRKLGRKMLGRTGASAVKLDGDGEVTAGLVVAEGVESAMAARTSLAGRWAAPARSSACRRSAGSRG
jgi:hypothetical protein